MSVFVSTEFHSTPIGDWGQATSLFILEQIRLSVKSHGTDTSRLWLRIYFVFIHGMVLTQAQQGMV